MLRRALTTNLSSSQLNKLFFLQTQHNPAFLRLYKLTKVLIYKLLINITFIVRKSGSIGMKIHLKKVFVSLLVIIGFVFYGFYQRFGDGLQTYFDNLRTGQVAAESYSDLDAASSKNQTSANPPLNISKNIKDTYSEPTEFSQTGQANTVTNSENFNDSIYKDGEYDGCIADAYYGSVQVRAIIESGKLSDVQFLSYPSDRSYSIEINKQAMPLLTADAIKIQCAQVDIVAGATNTSNAFIKSLDSALINAKTSSNTVSYLQTQFGTVDIISGATLTTAAAGSSDVISFLQSWGGAVDVVSGATNVSSGTTTTTDATVIQNQGTAVDVVSGATNVSSGDSSEDEEDSEDEHDEEDD